MAKSRNFIKFSYLFRIFYHSIVNLPIDPICINLEAILSVKNPIGYFVNSYFYYYGIVNSGDKKIVIGPTRQVPLSEQELKEIAFKADVPSSQTDDFVMAMQSIIPMPLESIMQMLCVLNHVLNGEKTELKEVSIFEDKQKRIENAIEQSRVEETISSEFDLPSDLHNTISIENTIQAIVRKTKKEDSHMDLQRAKIYNDGSHFIATPRNAFPHRRGKKYKLSRQPFNVQKVDLPHSNSPPIVVNENLPPTTPKQKTLPTTPKEKFESAYKESLSLPKRDRKAHIEKIKQKERRIKDKLIGELVDIKRNMVHMNYKRGFVLGVNDETQISNVSFIGDVGIELSLIKSKQRTFYELQNFPEYIKNSDIIYMFGLSMGETDKMYWDYIYQWLKKKKSHTLIFNTYNKYCNPLDLIEIKKIVSNARSRIDAYMPSVSSQISVVVNANIFSFRKRIPFIK